MGKVGGVASATPRTSGSSSAPVAGLLDGVHVVRPQNVFGPLPWHAR